MRRVVLILLCGLLAGGGAGALAHKAPPRHHAVKKKHHRHKPAAKKPVKKPVHHPAAATTPTVPATTPAPAPVDTPTTPADTAAPVTTPPAPLAHTLGVTASDAQGGGFALSLSRTVLGEGAELVQFRNISQDGHDLRIDAAGDAQQAVWDELDSLAPPVSKTVSLTAGTYRVYCTLHLGMERQLTVQAG